MRRIVVALCVSLVACERGDGSDTDLPTGWANAERVSGFVQMDCSGPVGADPYEEQAMFEPGAGSVHVVYQDAYFRCEQDVEGFALRGQTALEMLVQPVDMDPDEVAGCDCLYHIEFDVLDLEAGELDVNLERRADNLEDPNDPVPIAARTVTIE